MHGKKIHSSVTDREQFSSFLFFFIFRYLYINGKFYISCKNIFHDTISQRDRTHKEFFNV